MVRRVWRHKKKTQQPIEVASHRAGKQTQGRAGRCLAANCLHWGNDVASLKACKVPRPGAGNRRCYRKSPGAHARTMADTHTHTQKCLGVPQKHTPGDKGSVYQRHTHTHKFSWHLSTHLVWNKHPLSSSGSSTSRSKRKCQRSQQDSSQICSHTTVLIVVEKPV